MGLASACYAVAGAEPVYVDSMEAPVAYETAPQYDYEGRTVYYVNDHWYARDRGGWVYYRSEPAPLARYRTQVPTAPRAPERPRVIAQPSREPAPRAEPERHEDAPRAAPAHDEKGPRAEPERHEDAPRVAPAHDEKGPRPERDRRKNAPRAEHEHEHEHGDMPRDGDHKE